MISSPFSVNNECLNFSLAAEEESITGKTEEEQGQGDEFEQNDAQFSESGRPGEVLGQSTRTNREEGKIMRVISGRAFHCQGKNMRINIPVTNPTRTFSAITYLLWDDLVSQSSRKCGPDGKSRLHINKTKLHHAEKMIKGASIELYKGLGYLKTYR